MPLLSSHLLIQSYGILIITLGITLIRLPTLILNSPTLTILGDSMHIRPATYVPLPSLLGKLSNQSMHPLASLTKTGKTSLTTAERELLALLGAVFATSAITMMVLASSLSFSKAYLTSTTTLDGKVRRKSSAEVAEAISKLVSSQDIFMLLSGIHVFIMSSLVAWIYVTKADVAEEARSDHPGSWAILANQTSFILALMDMLFWGYLYTVIKEERRQVLLVGQERRNADAEDEANSRG